MKRILIVGAGFLQSFLIKRTKELGFYTIAIDKNPKAEGFKYANESGVIDIINLEECLEFAKSKHIDGIITAATDYGVLSTSYVAKELRLNALDFEVAKIIKDKYKVREIFYKLNVDDINFFKRVDDTNLENLNLKEIERYLPIIVKPVDGSGSKGVKKVEDIDDLISAIDNGIINSLSKSVLLESYIQGVEYGAEAFVVNNEIKMLEILGKNMTAPPKYAELGHYYPVEDKVSEIIKYHIEKAVKALKINYGSVNFDILVDEQEHVYIVDVGARMGGNLISSHIIPLGTDIPYLDNSIYGSVGLYEKFNFYSNHSNNVVTKLLAFEQGKLSENINVNILEKNYNVKIYSHLVAPTEVKEYSNNLDGYGYILNYSLEDLNSLHQTNQNVFNEINRKITR